MKRSTICVQGSYNPKNGEARVLPIYQSTTYKYDNSDELADIFDLTNNGFMYSRISNPTVDAVEKKIAALEGGVGALMTSSGQAASFISIVNIASSGDNILSFNNLYGGTTNLLSVRLKEFGIETRFINDKMSDEEILSKIDDKTRLLFSESLSNPSLQVLDIKRFSTLVHSVGLPLIVDNTFPTPILCRPFEHGADIVVHSTTKYMDGHAQVIGGVIVDSGKTNWSKFKGLNEADESYHGVVYTRDFGSMAYIIKARVQLMRDLGSTCQAMSAYLTNLGLETLDLRIKKHSSNALEVARYLTNNKKIESVNYPGLENNKYYDLAKKYLDDGMSSGVIGLVIKGGKENAKTFMNNLKMIMIVTHVADARTCVLHPASTTHRQLTDEQLTNAGISAGFVRLSVGIEDVQDIIRDLEQALEKI